MICPTLSARFVNMKIGAEYYGWAPMGKVFLKLAEPIADGFNIFLREHQFMESFFRK